MKKLFLVIYSILLSSLTYNLYAQNKNGEGVFGLSVSVNDAQSQLAFLGGAELALDADGNMLSGGQKTNNSFSLSFTPKYYINRQWLIRFEYGITNIDLENYNVSHSSGYNVPVDYPITYDTVKQKISRYVASIQWNFFSEKKIESYGGVSLQYINYAAITRNTYTEYRDVATDTLTVWQLSDVNIPGGYAIGLGVFAGFNFYVQKHISLGAEFSSALLHYSVGGTSSGTDIQQNIPSSVVSTTYTNYESYKGTRFTKILSSFNLTFWL